MEIKGVYLGSNASFSEILKYGTQEQIKEGLELAIEEMESLKVEAVNTSSLYEQLAYARELIRTIRGRLESNTRLNRCKEQVLSDIQESSFEL